MMFLDNKYTKTYFKLIEKAKNNLFEGYTEKHHIIPKSLGGSNDENNLVTLTARQHFIAHLLLTKMIDGQKKYKMYNAFSKMLCVSKDNKSRYLPSSKFYEYSKKLMSEYMLNDNPSKREDVRKKMSDNSWTKSDRSDEIKKIISQKKLGKKLNLTEEQRKNRSKKRVGKNNGMYGKTHTKEVREKISLCIIKKWPNQERDHLDHRPRKDIPRRDQRRDPPTEKDHQEERDNLPADPLEPRLNVMLPETLEAVADVLPTLELEDAKTFP